MDTITAAILAALGLLILFALVFRGTISVKLWGMDFKTKRDSQSSKSGTSIRDVQAGGNITANDQTGRGAEISHASAGRDVTASSVSGVGSGSQIIIAQPGSQVNIGDAKGAKGANQEVNQPGNAPDGTTERRRRIDAAVPSRVRLGASFDLLVQVRLPDSPPLGIQDWPSKPVPEHLEQAGEPVPIPFPTVIDPTTLDESGKPVRRVLQARLLAKVIAPDFTIEGNGEKPLNVPPEGESNKVSFLLTAKKRGTCRINVEIYNRDREFIGTIPVSTDVNGGTTVQEASIASLTLVVIVNAPPATTPERTGSAPEHPPLKSEPESRLAKPPPMLRRSKWQKRTGSAPEHSSLKLEPKPEEPSLTLERPEWQERTGPAPEYSSLDLEPELQFAEPSPTLERPEWQAPIPARRKHVFLSYCRDNADIVARIRADLIAAGETVWWDQDILPGQDWKFAIRQAMKESFAVVLCLSREAEARVTSGINPEALDAIAAYREYSPGGVFLIPMRLSDCGIPPLEIDGTRTLDRLQYVDLFPSAKRDAGFKKLLAAIRAAPFHPAKLSTPHEVRRPERQSTAPKSPAPGTPAGQLVLLSQNYVCGPLHQLPSLTEHFTGRTAELEVLCKGIRQRAKEGKPTAIVSAVEGLPGVGKTELAVAAAYMLAEDFSDAQIILHLAAHSTSPATPAQVRDELLHMVHPDAKLPEDDDALQKLYQNIFRNDDSGQPRRMLLILDDVSGDDQVRALMPPPGCAVLITSRRALESGESLRLTKFLPAEAIALLRSFRADLSEADAGAVAELCGFLAIALQAAGGFLKCHASKPAAEYIDELRDDPLNRLHHEDAQFDVNVVFERSLRDMTATQRAAFHRLSVMASGFDREAALAVAGSNGNDLDELVRLNLLEFHRPTERFDWHDLLRAFAAKGLTPGKELAARVNHARHFTAVAKHAHELYMTRGKILDGLALFDRERRNIEAAFEFLHSICSGGLRPLSEDSAVQPAVTDRRYSKESVVVACRQLVALVDAVAYTGGLRFHPRHQHIPWLEAQLAAASEIGDRRGEGNALGNLGIAYKNLGDAREAINYFEQALVILREIGDRRGEGNALGSLGLAYANLGDAHKAIEFYEKVLVIHREIGDRRGEGTALGNLGIAYANLGDARKAIEFYEKALVIAREIGDRRGEGNALGNLGIAYKNLGEARKAIEFYEQQLVIVREIGDRRGEGTALWNSALALETLGQRDEAIKLAEAALKIFEQIEDPYAAKVRAALEKWKKGAKS